MTAALAAVAHAAFEWAGIFTGVRLYLRSSRLSVGALGQTRHYGVVIGCIIGAAIGNKAVHWLHRADQWPLLRDDPWLVFQGQSIVGGLLGGLIGVEIAKSVIGSRESTGDRFVTPILAGLFIGRIGCLLAGLNDDTYGVATSLPWGMDLGDGIRRHPTALYDMLFAVAAWFVLWRWRTPLARESGLRFKLLLAGYLAWRLLIDGLKPVPYEYAFGLSGIQAVCALALVVYLPFVVTQLLRLRR